MPIYEFRCTSCGIRFERLCSMGESGKNLKCPGCGARHPDRVMSTFISTGTGGGKGTGTGCGTCSSHDCSNCGH
ncbi:MAG TPA: zinc ribbon domain-containing protein [Bacillota bacterium]|nr:zinc ribbon domain-containing protein [Bacillota bacterium]